MRFALAAVISLMLTAASAGAQTNEILRAPQADFVYISIKPTGSATPFDYTLDRRASGEWSKPLKPGMLITAKKPDGVNIMLEFLNPMSYSWSVSDSAVDSGVGKASASFLSAVTAQFGAIGGLAPVSIPATNSGKTEATSAGASANGFSYTRVTGGATALVGWRLWLDEGRARCFLDTTTETRIKLQATAVEQALYGAASSSDPSSAQFTIKSAEDYRGALFAAITGLRDAANMDELRKAVVRAKKTVNDLENADQRVRESVQSLNVQLQGAFGAKPSSVATISEGAQKPIPAAAQAPTKSSATVGSAAIDTSTSSEPEKILHLLQNEQKKSDAELRKEITQAVVAQLKAISDASTALAAAASCESFQRFTTATMQALSGDANDLLLKRSSVVRELRNLLSSIDRLLQSVRPTENDFSLGTFLPNESTDRVACVSVQRRELSIDNERVTVLEQPATRSCLRLSRSRRVIFEAAPGVAYSNVRYTRFGTASGTVSRASDDIQRVVPMIMLNVLPAATDGRVIGQLGVGSARDYPAFLTGIGLRFSAAVDWSVTAGAIWTWNRYLKSLEIGAPVSGTAALESDIGVELRQRPGLYVGLQLGIP